MVSRVLAARSTNLLEVCFKIHVIINSVPVFTPEYALKKCN